MEYVLVLNVSYQALGIIDIEKAISLVVINRAEIVHPREGIYHSQKLIIPIPSVIRLFRNIKPKRNQTVPMSRRALFARDDYECQYCGDKTSSPEIDHIHPRSKGGGNDWLNVVCCCRKCNGRKADRDLAETGMKLRRQPFTPTRANMISMRGEPEWEQFLK